MRRRKSTPKPWVEPLPTLPARDKRNYKALRATLGTQGLALLDTLCWIHTYSYNLAALDKLHGFADVRATHEELRVRSLAFEHKERPGYFSLNGSVAILARHAQKDQNPVTLLRCLCWIDDLFVGFSLSAPEEHRVFFGFHAQNVCHYAWKRGIAIPTARMFRLIGSLLKHQGDTKPGEMFEERARQLFHDTFHVPVPGPNAPRAPSLSFSDLE